MISRRRSIPLGGFQFMPAKHTLLTLTSSDGVTRDFTVRFFVRFFI
jgi:hypothetical protein